jgi:myo-inositol-1(or 4)-monophosphatase
MSDLNIEIQAAVSAGKLIQNLKDNKLSVDTKESLRDVVTEVDIIAEKEILSILSKENDRPIVSEETQNIKDLPEDCWVVDPIDGTANFLENNPNYCVSIGRLDKFKIQSGVIYAPTYNDLYYTHQNKAYKNKTRISAPKKELKNSTIAFSLPGRIDAEDNKTYWNVISDINNFSRGAIRLGSAALHLAWHSEARFGGCIGFGAQIWDIAAGISIARCSGSLVRVFESHINGKYDYICGCEALNDELYIKLNTQSYLGKEIIF